MTSHRPIFPNLRQIVSFYNILLLSKFEVNLMFQTEVIRDKKPYVSTGGCCTALFLTSGFSIEYYDFFCTTFEEKIKLHTSKRFFQKTFKIGQNSPPPIDTQTIKLFWNTGVVLNRNKLLYLNDMIIYHYLAIVKLKL